jgi:hypothetical protein
METGADLSINHAVGRVAHLRGVLGLDGRGDVVETSPLLNAALDFRGSSADLDCTLGRLDRLSELARDSKLRPPISGLTVTTRLDGTSALHFADVSSFQSQMLALTDTALARICIGATAIAPHERDRWLKNIAAKLDPPQAPTPAARRQARVRARRRDGVHIYRIEVSDRAAEGLILKFILSGQLTEMQALEHRNVENAMAALLEEEGQRHR